MEIFFAGNLIYQEVKRNNLLKERIVSILEKRISEDKKENLFFEENVIFNPVNLTWQAATTQAPFSKRDAHTAVVFRDKIWLLGGVGGSAPDYGKITSDIWVSENGKDWTEITDSAPWGPRRAHNAVLFQDKIWILGGVTKGEK